MKDDSGTSEYKVTDISQPKEQNSQTGFSKDEIDSLADLIRGDDESKPGLDLDDTGRFTR